MMQERERGGPGRRQPEDRVLTLDELFKKTAAKPCIYWLPLTGGCGFGEVGGGVCGVGGVEKTAAKPCIYWLPLTGGCLRRRCKQRNAVG